MAGKHSTKRTKQRAKQSLWFTKAALTALPVPAVRTYYYDEKERKLGLIHHPASATCPEGAKTFFARVTLDGRTKRQRIPNGTFPGMPIELAREKAQEESSKAAKGIDSAAERRARKAAEAVTGLTVEQAVNVFAAGKVRRLSTGQKLPLKESTKASYRHSIQKLVGKELYTGPLVKLTEDAITKRIHIGEKSGKTYTATGCRSLSAVWNWLAKQKDYRGQLPENPVKQYALFNDGLHVAAPKQSRIEREELPSWFDAVEALPTEYADFFLWLLFTGTRRGEALALEWPDIDWRRGVYHLRDPKNRRDVTLPVPDFMARRLKRRRQDTGKVFPFDSDARHQRKKVEDKIDKLWAIHDLRRTFAGIAQSVCSFTSVKRLMNHTFTDVTEDYIGESAELGEEVDKVQREILRLAGRPAGNVVALEVVK